MASQTYDVGIDEAGRGPVLGPMVYGACCWPTDFEKDAEVVHSPLNDSKELSAGVREKLLCWMEQLKVDSKGEQKDRF
jgi:ribonuclease H2 subunit A